MKKFTKIMSAAVLAAASLSLSGCQEEDFGFNAAEIKYQTEFTRAFGKIDPNQDWNYAKRGAVTVTTNASSNVKVYALTNGTYRLVADYSEVSGTKTLGFDIREDVTDLMVTDGCTAVKAKVGESVSFGGTRAGHYGTTGGVRVTAITDESQWFVFNRAESERYQEKLPEGGKDWDNDGHKDNNLGQVTQNFTFISNGEFTVYPIYWQTGDTDEVGIYYTDANGVYHEIPIYTIKSGDELQYRTMKTHHDCRVPSDCSELPSVGDECPVHSGHTILHINHSNGSDYCYVYCDVDAPWSDVGAEGIANSKFSTQTALNDHYIDLVKDYRSKGIKVNIPEGTLFGMYNYAPAYSKKQYSEQEKNGSTFNHPANDVVAATFTLPSSQNPGEEDMYLCFEDWWATDGDADLNDVVLRFYGSTPTVVDEDADKWVICAEDLGNTFDLDYNDVVVSVSHISGKDKAYITPLAAGGTLASHIYFGSTHLGEIHELFGASKANSGSYEPINVFGSINHSAPEMEVSVATNWSLASSTVGDDSFDDTEGKAMGGFTVKVVPAGKASDETNAEGTQVIQSNYTSGNQNIPYVICVPQQWERTGAKGWFRWSNETTPISPLSGYNESGYNTPDHTFADWVSNKENDDWFMYPDEDNTTGQQGVITTTPTQPSGDDDDDDPVGPDPTPGTTSTQLTESNDALAFGDGSGYDNYATFSTSNLPTEGNVIFSVEITKSNGYINAQNKGIWKSSDGTNFTQIQNPTFKAGNEDGVVEYTVSASEYTESSYLKIITDSGQGATITKVSYKIAQ